METVATGSVLAVGPYAPSECCLRRILDCKILKTFMFLLFAVFILCIPLGDPDEQCSRINGKSIAINYMCFIHRIVNSVFKFSCKTISKSSEFAHCVIINALYDAKLKFYNILETVDRKDLCRSVCCLETEHEGSDDPTPKERKCSKCKGRYCKRTPSHSSGYKL